MDRRSLAIVWIVALYYILLEIVAMHLRFGELWGNSYDLYLLSNSTFSQVNIYYPVNDLLDACLEAGNIILFISLTCALSFSANNWSFKPLKFYWGYILAALVNLGLIGYLFFFAYSCSPEIVNIQCDIDIPSVTYNSFGEPLTYFQVVRIPVVMFTLGFTLLITASIKTKTITLPQKRKFDEVE